MKIPLTQVLQLGRAMRQIEACGLTLTPGGQLAWALHHKRIFEFVDPYVKTLTAEFSMGPQTEQAMLELDRRLLDEINGQEVELTLPAPIQEGALKELACRTHADVDALCLLLGTVLAEPVAQTN